METIFVISWRVYVFEVTVVSFHSLYFIVVFQQYFFAAFVSVGGRKSLFPEGAVEHRVSEYSVSARGKARFILVHAAETVRKLGNFAAFGKGKVAEHYAEVLPIRYHRESYDER